MHDSYFRVRLSREDISPRPSSYVTFVNPERSLGELKTIYRAYERHSTLAAAGIVAGAFTVLASLAVLAGIAGVSGIVMAIAGLVVSVATTFAANRLGYSSGKDYYRMELSTGVALKLRDLEVFAREGWLHPNESRAVAGILVRLWEKEITSESRAMLEAFDSYRETAGGRRDAAEAKLVSDTVRQNASEA